MLRAILMNTTTYSYILLKKQENMKNAYLGSATKTRLFKYIENFTPKNWKFSYK